METGRSTRSCEEAPMLDQLPIKPTQKLKQYLATISVCLGAFCAGTVISWTSPALPQILIDANETNISLQSMSNTSQSAPGFKITEQQSAIVGAMLTIGALVAAIPTGYLADKFGRKKVILGLSVPFLLNWILIIFSTNVNMVIAGRFFAGIGLGGICVTVPMYIGEIAQASHRGVFGSFFAMFLCVGILMSCVVGSFTNWVGLSLILSIGPIIFAASFCFMPETPVYLVEVNKLEEAEMTLKEFRGSNYDVSAELKAIQKDVQESHEKTATLRDVITSKANLRAVISVLGVLAFQQLSGVNAVVFYTEPIFKAAGSSMSPSLAAIIINIVQVVVSYISIMIIEKANRKFFLMFSSTGMVVCLAALGMYFHLKRLDLAVNIGYIPIVSVVLFMICFSIGYGPIPWMLMGELFSPEIKGIASGMAVLTNWVFAFIVTFCFPLLNASVGGHITFYMFSVIMAGATGFVYFVVPETRGKSLAEIQEFLNR